MRILKLNNPEKQAEEERKRSSIEKIYNTVYLTVESIIKKVIENGDSALIYFTKEFDGVDIRHLGIEVDEDEIRSAYESVNYDFIEAINMCKDRLETFERKLLSNLVFELNDEIGVRISQIVRPINSVGCYIPRGQMGYPSTVIMTCVPAKVAGVKRIVVCTPPRKDGSISPYVLVAADIVGVDSIYRVGGAHAIAALAYGTESIEKVDKIVGPGNIYVSIAKLLVSQFVPIDFFAGPTELLIFADEYADPKQIVYDMISQAEHDPHTLIGLITTSKKIAEGVLDMLMNKLNKELEKKAVVEPSITNGFIAYGNIKICLKFINNFAPEHLHILARNPDEIVSNIDNAGVILLGPFTPTSLSDYCLGTNHVLPTMGRAKQFSGLSVIDFVKIIRVAKADKNYIRKYGSYAKKLAKIERFIYHAKSIEVITEK